MKVTYLQIAHRRVYFAADEIDEVMARAARARDHGEWFEVDNPQGARGARERWLLPSQALLEVHEYEVVDESPDDGPHDTTAAAWNESMDVDFE